MPEKKIYNLHIRPRRLRQSNSFRRLVQEKKVHPNQVVLPIFIADGINEPKEIPSMPGVYQHTLESVKNVIEEANKANLGGVMLFGVPTPEDKDPLGTKAYEENGILNRALKVCQSESEDNLLIMADTCLDEFTSHGHCGVLTPDGLVDNDKTLELYEKMAISQVEAGANILGLSGMMDGQVGAIRNALDTAGYNDAAILAYTAKYASVFYGPFREAVGSSLKGNRKTYQQDVANRRESLRELELDIEEGADIVMVKPAMGFLDILADVSASSPVPVAAYQVSGEYSMISAAAFNGWIDLDAAIIESITSIGRAGADIVLTYWALQYVELLGKL